MAERTCGTRLPIPRDRLQGTTEGYWGTQAMTYEDGNKIPCDTFRRSCTYRGSRGHSRPREILPSLRHVAWLSRRCVR